MEKAQTIALIGMALVVSTFTIAYLIGKILGKNDIIKAKDKELTYFRNQKK